ncbi:hypothetical protein IIY24_01160 [Candidatus Saccharibacteria bacterium]|nr:hypothetical protein [Candidatus Saccharibacteria bacterium]
MAKEIAIGKRAKISEAQQYMLLAVLGASIFLGVAISLIFHFIKQISFNANVIMAEDQSIVAYSNIIKNIGICTAPSGATYSDSELAKCDPNSIDASQIPGTLRANILEGLASNEALNSVPKEDNSSCRNPDTGKNFTYKELTKIYSEANGSDELQSASHLIRSCSALRIIPDALPAFQNEEALLASLNKLFNISDWQPESISPSDSYVNTPLAPGLNATQVNLSVTADPSKTMTVLHNIERSIREFDFERATISWENNGELSLTARATADYMNESSMTETTKTIKAEGK